MNTLLIVVDYQNDFVNGTLGFPEAEALEGPICEKIASYRQAGGDIAYTLDTHGTAEEYLASAEGRKLPVPHCERESHGWMPYGRVAEALEGARCFEKNTFGCLDLVPFLQEKAYEQVELCGLVCGICVAANAVIAKAALPEAHVMVDASCTAGADAANTEETLRVLEGMQIDIIR